MPLYEYTAKRGPGAPETGELRAVNSAEALAGLESRGLTPIRIREIMPAGVRRRGGAVGFGEITRFTRQMAGLLKAGVPILRALTTVASQGSSLRFARLVDALADAIRNGGTLSSAMASHPRQFPAVYVSMVRAGESAGALERVLLRLAEEREHDEEQRRRVQAAIAYPALLVVVGIVTVFVLLAYFMPRIAVMFEGWARLPLPTRLLMSVSGWVAEYRMAILLAVAMPLILLHRVSRSEKGRLMLDRWVLRMPLAGQFVLISEIARFARTLALLIKAGVAIAPALELASDTVRNLALRAELESVRESTVKQGRAFSEGLMRASVFPPFLTTMTAVGEQSGRIDETLEETAAYYEREIARISKMATALIEPVLILIIGGLVGFIVAAMLLPIFEIGAGGLGR